MTPRRDRLQNRNPNPHQIYEQQTDPLPRPHEHASDLLGNEDAPTRQHDSHFPPSESAFHPGLRAEVCSQRNLESTSKSTEGPGRPRLFIVDPKSNICYKFVKRKRGKDWAPPHAQVVTVRRVGPTLATSNPRAHNDGRNRW